MKREQLMRELRKIAKERNASLTVATNRGKGSHIRVKLGDRMTTIKDGELTPSYVRLIKKQLGV